MAAVQYISDRQVAEIVTNLARGRSIATTAARSHMAATVVEEIGRLNGYPDTVELNRNARVLNKRLRDAVPVEDLTADVPISVPREPVVSGSGPSSEVEEPEADELDAVIWRCSVCDFDVVAPASASLWDVRREVADHEATHQLGLTAEQVGVLHDVLTHPVGSAEASQPAERSVGVYECPDCSWTIGWAGASADPEDDREVDDYREQQIEDHEAGHRAQHAAIEQAELAGALAEAGRQIALAASAHNHTDEEVRYPTCPACRASSEVPLVIEGELEETVVLPGPVMVGIRLTSSHRHPNPDVYFGGCPQCRAEMGHVPATNGHAQPEKLGDLLAPMISPTPLPGEAQATVVAEQPAAVAVEEPPAAPAPTPAGAGWLASGPRTVERLLDEAEGSGSPRLAAAAAAVRETLQVLADLVDDWTAKADERRAILHELDVLGRRQDELTEKLARLDAGYDLVDLSAVTPRPPTAGVVVSQTPVGWRDAAAELTQPAPVPEPVLSRVEKLRALPFNRMSVEQRARCKAWAIENGHQVVVRGMQPKATVEAYLAAHPEDDPR